MCWKKRCPIILKLYAFIRISPYIRQKEIEGSSPPGIFIGRLNYPHVNVGPLVPPMIGDTSFFDYPEQWKHFTLDEIINFRISLIRGKVRMHVRDATKQTKIVEIVQELAMSKYPVDTYVGFKKKPYGILLDGEVQPIGPAAPIHEVEVDNVKTDHLIERVSNDEDLKALEAVKILFNKNMPISKIIRAMSAGLFGLSNERKFVPTRWSITAVDSMLSRYLRDEIIKQCPVIPEYRVYESTFLGDKFLVIMFPDKWSYEFIEAWFPGTAWNLDTETIAIGGDWELYWGRSNYAKIGGCYYAARLAVAEHLSKIKKQATVLILREAYPEHIMPLGVWHVREGVRSALETKPIIFEDIKDVFKHISKRMKISLSLWFEVSSLLKHILQQTKLPDFF